MKSHIYMKSFVYLISPRLIVVLEPQLKLALGSDALKDEALARPRRDHVVFGQGGGGVQGWSVDNVGIVQFVPKLRRNQRRSTPPRLVGQLGRRRRGGGVGVRFGVSLVRPRPGLGGGGRGGEFVSDSDGRPPSTMGGEGGTSRCRDLRLGSPPF